MKQDNSKKYFEQAKKVLVEGVNSPVRSFKGVNGAPIVMRNGYRQSLYDYDGNQYTDYCLSWGALILGHANRNVVLNAKKLVERGLSFGTTTRDEIELAKHIKSCISSIEKIRFVNSGTEATMSAIRLARGFTGRDMIVKFDGCYHGHFDDLLTQAGSGVATLQESSSKGIPQSHIQNTLSLPYNNEQVLSETLQKYRDKIACVIIEPVAGNMGVIPSDKQFLKTLRKLTSEFGIILIFDEIMTGFRGGLGCVQADYGITPDLTCLGKVIGSGFPIGAYGGKKEIMQCLAPSGPVYQAGTFSGNPVVMRAGLMGLKQLNQKVYQKLNHLCEEFANTMNKFFNANTIPAHIVQYKSMMSIRFRPESEPVRDYEDAKNAAGGEKYAKLFWHLLEDGIYWPPADLEAYFVSTLHTKKDLNALAKSLQSFFLTLK
jgi:glutamate-1-semialdehyde 2,1-aminomutase